MLENLIVKAKKNLLRFVSTENCLICGLNAGDNIFRQSELLRLGCLKKNSQNKHLVFLRNNTCRACLMNLPFVFPYQLWQLEDSGIEVRSLCTYEYPINKLLLDLKFRHRKQVALWFAHLIYVTQYDYWMSNNDTCIVPIPLGEKRLQERGFNQAALLAEFLAQFAQIRIISDLLIRKRETKRQTETSSRRARLANLDSAFQINPVYLDFLENSEKSFTNVLLIDDVSTTGITLQEAAKPLRSYKIKVKAFVTATEHELIPS